MRAREISGTQLLRTTLLLADRDRSRDRVARGAHVKSVGVGENQRTQRRAEPLRPAAR